MDLQRVEEKGEKEKQKRGVKKNGKNIKEKDDIAEKHRRAFLFMLLLLGLTIILYALNKVITKKRFSVPLSKQPLLSFAYIFFYGIIGGILIFFGIKNFNDFLKIYIKDPTLVDLVSVSVVIAFTLLYSAYFKDIIATLTGVKISINVYKNVLGYILARIFLTVIIFFAHN